MTGMSWTEDQMEITFTIN